MQTLIEKHYTVLETAEILSVSNEKARQLFMHEPGVLLFPGPKRTTYRIPASVLERVLRRSANPPVFVKR